MGLKIAPKYRNQHNEVQASRLFTDREHYRESFRKALLEQDAEIQKVLVFYGVGGIGKSRLIQELMNDLSCEKGYATAKIDFRNVNLRSQAMALYALRDALNHSQKYDFPLFDIAYAVYWQKSNPQIPLNKRDLPLIGTSEVLSSIMDATGGTPFFGLAVNLIKAVRETYGAVSRWQRIANDADLQVIDEKEPYEILDMLTYFLAQDFCNALEENKQCGVIFLDTYEMLWYSESGANTLQVDAWIRDLVIQTPGVLWVICGREFLRWQEVDREWSPPYLEQHIIGGLAPADSEWFLTSCGIHEPEVLRTIVTASEGVPFYLDLSVDLYEFVNSSRRPTPEDFGETNVQLMGRFIEHLSASEFELLKIISVSRYWNRELFHEIIHQFNINYPISKYDDFCAYSFNTQAEDQTWHMHQLMQKAIRDRTSADLLTEVHTFLYSYYRKRMEQASVVVSIQSRLAWFTEAIFHGLRVNAVPADWLYETAHTFVATGWWNLLQSTLLDAQNLLNDKRRNIQIDPAIRTLVDYFLAWIEREQGDIARAREKLKALDLSPVRTFRMSIEFQVANAIRESGGYDEAAAIYEHLVNEQPLPSHRRQHIVIAVQYADMLYVRGNFVDASRVLRSIQDEYTEGEYPKEVGEALRISGHINRLNEQRMYALSHYLRAQHLFESIDDRFGSARIATNLAETLQLMSPREAIVHGERAVEQNHLLGSTLEVGKATNAMALAYLLLKEYHTALDLCERALKVQEEIGYRSGVGMALLNRMYLHAAIGEQDLALQDALASAALFSAIHAYPLFVYAAGSFMLYLGMGNNELAALRQNASSAIRWVDTQAETDRRLQAMFLQVVGA